MGKKKYFIAAALLVLFCLGLALYIVIRVMVDPNAFKPELQAQVENLTGLRLQLQGDLSLKFYPWLGIEMGAASLGSPEGFQEGLVSVKHLSVETKLLPLLRGKIDAKGVHIEGLELNIVRNAQGRWNFQLLPVKNVHVDQDEVVVDTKAGESYRFSYLIRGIDLQDATVRVRDGLHHRSYELHNLNISASDVRTGKPFQPEISFDASSTQPPLSGSAALSGTVTMSPEALRFGFKDVDLEATVKAENLPFSQASAHVSLDSDIQAETGFFDLTRFEADATVKGGMFKDTERARLTGIGALHLEKGAATVRQAHLEALGLESELTVSATNVLADPLVTARVTTNRFNLRQLLKTLQIDLEGLRQKEALTQCAYDGDVTFSKHLVKIDARKLRVDAADLRVKASATLPGLHRFDLAVSGKRLNVCSFLPRKREADSGGGQTAPKAAKAAAAKAAPFSLRAYQGGVRLSLDELLCGKQALGSVALNASLKDGDLRVPELAVRMPQTSLSGSLQARFPKKGFEPDSGNAELKLRSANLRKALERWGCELPPLKNPKALGKTDAALHLSCTPKEYVLKAPKISMDGNTLSVTATASKPFPSRIQVNAKGGALNLTGYEPVRKSGAKQRDKKSVASKKKKTPVTLPPFLRKTDLFASVACQKLSYGPYTVSELVLDAASRKGNIKLSKLQGRIFGGSIFSSGSLGLHRSPAPLTVNLKARGVKLESLMAALGNKPYIAGRADVTGHFSARGLSEKQLRSTLSGESASVVTNGAILGVNLSRSALTSGQPIAGAKAKTRFTKAVLNSTAKNGVVRITKCSVVYPPNSVTGGGTIVLPKNTISAKLYANLKGLPNIPVIVSGPLDKPEIALDSAAVVDSVVNEAVDMVDDILSSPESLKKGIESIF